MNSTRLHRHRALVAGMGAMLAVLAGHAAALAPLADDPLVGHWRRTWPASGCSVTLEIRTDGTTTIQDGTNVVEATLHRTGPATEEGIFPVDRRVTRDNGEPTCTAGPDARPHPDGRPILASEDSPGHVQTGAMLLYAHGDALSLCNNTESGSCDHWFSRVVGGQRSVKAEPAHESGFRAFVERQFYAVVPENRRSFELIPASSVAAIAFDKDDAPDLGCDRFAGLQVVGDGFSGTQFHVAACHNAAAVAARAKAMVARARKEMQATTPLTDADRRKYGIFATDESLGDGAEVFYCYQELHGVDYVLPARYAVFIDAARARAVVVVGVDASMGERAPAFGDDPLGSDPVSAMKLVAEGIGRRAGPAN